MSIIPIMTSLDIGGCLWLYCMPDAASRKSHERVVWSWRIGSRKMDTIPSWPVFRINWSLLSLFVVTGSLEGSHDQGSCILNWVFFPFFAFCPGIATMHAMDCKNWQSNWQNNAFILIWKQGWDSWKQYYSRPKKSMLFLECIHFPHGIIMFLVTKFKPKTLKSTSKSKAKSGT